MDPIGIAGGFNVYGYGNADPINFSDPFGLCGQRSGEDPPEECPAEPEEQDDNRFQQLADWGAEQGGTLGWLGLNAGATLNAAMAVGDRISGVQCDNGGCHGSPLAVTRGGAFTKGGFLNSNRYLRVGIGDHRGQRVFRVSGQVIEKVKSSGHIDLFWLGPL